MSWRLPPSRIAADDAGLLPPVPVAVYCHSMPLTDIIRSNDPAVRNRPLAAACRGLTYPQLLAERDALDRFRRESANLYDRVRALFFLYAIDRFHLPARPELPADGRIPYPGVERLLDRRFDEAVRVFQAEEAARGPNDPLCSAL